MGSWRLSSIELGVRDLERSLAFYAGLLGLDIASNDGSRASLGAGSQSFLELTELPGASRDPAVAGLFHTAWLYPDRASLGQVLERVENAGVALSGAADHLVSEAIYLDDPDGHGVELYRDRPSTDWPRRDGRLQMANDPFDRDGISEAARQAARSFETSRHEITLGHVHLESLDLDGDERALTDALGLEKTFAWPNARFFAWNGYHHHLAINNWADRQKPIDVQHDNIGIRCLRLLGAEDARFSTVSGLDVVVQAA